MLLVGVICWAGLGLARCAAHAIHFTSCPGLCSRTLQTASTTLLPPRHTESQKLPRVSGATDPPFRRRRRRRAPPNPARSYMSPACSLLSPHTPWRILPLLLPLRLSSAVSAPALAVAMPRRDGVCLLLFPCSSRFDKPSKTLISPLYLVQTKPPQRKWKPKAAEVSYSSSTSDATELVEPVRKMTLASHAPPAGAGPVPGPGPAQLWVPRGYTTFAGDGPGIAPASTSTSGTVTAERDGVASEKLSRLFKSAPGFEVDNSTFTEAQIRATFYPKFENEKSDQEVRA
jgi:hypothetical protein